ncbi:LytR C-terminal domain-containing protein [Egicoccus halophilus]|uniref:LytR/CpsA/Psr regulator C-terminal domain-containing protein n=1 Tax=Egicoccus halophilus TaxID=1670830 RepID=A0A8J3AEC7_9ACTN|nr:LytR C-terminal domain-containing protein [Egicoccus halophilus]GGI06875.1 hypothetical protein GCM10011354_21280 [Egicoccus halophilus]
MDRDGAGWTHRTASAAQRRRLRRRARRPGSSLLRALAKVAGLAALGTLAATAIGATSLGPVTLPVVDLDPSGVATPAAVASREPIVRLVTGDVHATDATTLRDAGFTVFTVDATAQPGSVTRILVHRDGADALVVAADLRDVLRRGVIERGENLGDGVDLTVVLGADDRDGRR